MPTYNTEQYPGNHKKMFNFLIEEYQYFLVKSVKTDFGYIDEYRNNNIRIVMNYDVRDNIFYFDIINGYNTTYPNDSDNENIKMFHDLFSKHETVALQRVMPDEKQYVQSLYLNAVLLRKYGDKVLRGEEWV